MIPDLDHLHRTVTRYTGMAYVSHYEGSGLDGGRSYHLIRYTRQVQALHGPGLLGWAGGFGARSFPGAGVW